MLASRAAPGRVQQPFAVYAVAPSQPALERGKWLDYLERLSSAIRIEDLMGLVSELKEESQCKIVLLFNEEQLGDRAKEYQKASEKVVDKTLTPRSRFP